MGIFDNLRSLFPRNEKSTNAASNEHWITISGGDTGINDRNLLLNNKEWVFIAVDKVALAVSAVRFKVMRYQRNGDDREVFDGPLAEFLEKPGHGFTGKDFIYLNTVYKELTGNAFWERDDRAKLKPMIPNNVQPIWRNGEIAGYKYTENGSQRVLLAKRVLHDRYVDPKNPHWGAGKLERIARWADTASFANEFLRRFFVQGASFGGFIETEEESMERIKLIKAGLANDHTGVSNAHKWGVLPKGSKAQRVTANMNEIEMGATADRYRDNILSAFGVPKSLVGLVEDVNRSNAEANEYVFAQYTVKPIVEDFIEFLNVQIAPMLDPTGNLYFAYDDFVPANEEVRLKEREIALNRQPYKTVNEVRAEQGLPPVDGGDVVYGQPFQMPLGNPQAAPEPAPAGGDPVDPDEDDPGEPQRALPRGARTRLLRTDRTRHAIENVVERIAGQLEGLTDQQELADETAHKDFVGRVESFLERMEKAVVLFNSEQRNKVVKDLKRITKAVSKGDLFDMDTEVGAMVTFVEPVLRGLMSEQALAEYEAQGFEGTFDSGDAMLQRTTELAAKRLAKSYNNTTAKLLKIALNDGIQKGEGLDQLTKRVQEVYEFSDTSRARAVAHTESFYIANEGNKEAYRQSGVVKSTRWYTAEDERVCPHCEPMNGTVIDVNDVYFKKGDQMVGSDGSILKLNYRSIGVPPLHTNCRCFIRPETISIE